MRISLSLLAVSGLLAGSPFLHAAEAPTYVTSFGSGQLSFPLDIARVSATGDFFVTDNDHARVQKFSAAGAPVSTFGSDGTDPGKFSGIVGITTDGTYLYTTEEYAHRVQKFALDGTFVSTSGAGGIGNGQFSSPIQLTFSPLGLLHVVEYNANRVQAFSSSGVFQSKFGSFGNGNGQFQKPRGIAINQNTGKIYIADYDNYRVQRFSADGTFELKWGSFGSGNGQFGGNFGVAIDSADRVYISDDNNNIQRFSADGEFDVKFGSGGDGPGQFGAPRGMVVYLQDGRERLAVVDSFNNRVQVFDIGPAPGFVAPTPADQTLPTLTLTGSKRITTSSATAKLKGKASDAGGTVVRVEVKVGKKGKYKPARGTTSWSFTARNLVIGSNVVNIRSVDAAGNVSNPTKITVLRRAAP